MSEAAAAAAKKPLPIVPFLKIPEKGEPYLEGARCTACKAVFLGSRDVCASCGARRQLEPTKLSNRGELYVYSITHRSFPGIETPYVSAVVDLEGGGTVKGNLIGIDPDPKQIKMGMKVEVIYKIAPRKDREGNEYLTYYFQPAKSA
ncbi:MAG TPA: Zn-ribbon domain-containing OB-fold protein [Myxococcota bacterium]|nr:Zn-ribbon domain-containing OB-fold protein [Myxococcota bacterium]